MIINNYKFKDHELVKYNDTSNTSTLFYCETTYFYKA